MLTKSARYYYDETAVRENSQDSRGRVITEGHTSSWKYEKGMTGKIENYGGKLDGCPSAGRSMRDVWTIPTQGFSIEMCLACKRIYAGAEYKRLGIYTDEDGEHRVCRKCGKWDKWLSHFATFPEELCRRPILCSTSAVGACPKCGAAWERVVDKEFIPQQDVSAERGIRLQGQTDESNGWDGSPRGSNSTKTIDWQPRCKCGLPQEDNVPCVCFDPFMGSGTLAVVALRLGRNFVGTELSEDYIKLAEKRIEPLLRQGRLRI